MLVITCATSITAGSKAYLRKHRGKLDCPAPSTGPPAYNSYPHDPPTRDVGQVFGIPVVSWLFAAFLIGVSVHLPFWRNPNASKRLTMSDFLPRPIIRVAFVNGMVENDTQG